MHGPLVTLALVGVYALLGCTAFEIGFRAHSERPVFALDNWRAERIEYLLFGDRGVFDPLLGWAPREWHESAGFSTLAHGIRRNFEEQEVRTGAILVVGGWFADGGNDVGDHETWPAQLEGMTGTPVLNAGMAGYATDQIVLRAEQLLAVVKPKTVVVGFVEEDIARARYASFGIPKPYFTLDRGELAYHPPAPIVVYDPAEPAWRANVRQILGHSAVLDVVLSRLAPGYWHGRAGQHVQQEAQNDPIAVTCALLQRLKRRSDADRVRLLLFMQHGFRAIAETEAPGEDARKVVACATTMGVEVVDEFASLRAVAIVDRDTFGDFYLEEDDGTRLMSPEGNRHAAELLARALGSRGPRDAPRN